METELAERLLKGRLRSGVYRIIDTAVAHTLSDRLAAAGWDFFLVDSVITNKEEFLEATAASMRFPSYFGDNWDAFNDCITDLTFWCTGKGYAVLFTDLSAFAANQPQEYQTALSILEDAAAFWENQSTPFFALLGSTNSSLPEIH